MVLNDLIKYGYFPRELPPPFNTHSFADNLTNIFTDYNVSPNSYKESQWTNFSIPKLRFNRRMLGIPNPLHQYYLTNEIVNHWTQISGILNKSNSSYSKPKQDNTNRRGALPEYIYPEFKKHRIIESYSNLYELKIDISRYYPTIYTHIIPWIIHTKFVAKSNRTNTTFLGNRIDKALRETNVSQTMGIPIGPDTSLIISEIILCTIDEEIQNKFPAVKGFRYFDDFHFYCSNYSTAEEILKFIQSIFTEYLFEINEDKTIINKFPFAFESPWSIDLNRFEFRSGSFAQQTDLERFVSICFNHAQNYPNDSVLSYAMKIIQGLYIYDQNWNIYESLILKIAIVEPITLNIVTEILALNEKRVNKDKIKKIIETIISEHVSKGHQYEVSWALWMCKEFGITIDWTYIEVVFKSEDTISTLIAMDLIKSRLVSNYTNQITFDSLISSSLMDEKWILTYEAIKNQWVTPTTNIINSNRFFEILNRYDVSFYDPYKMIATRVLPSIDFDFPTFNSVISHYP